MGPGRANFKGKTLEVALICIGLQASTGCVVRTQEFHCTRPDPDGPVLERDLEMTPTEMRFSGQTFHFRDESGVERLYRSASGETLHFNVASNQLRSGSEIWSCRRYLAP